MRDMTELEEAIALRYERLSDDDTSDLEQARLVRFARQFPSTFKVQYENDPCFHNIAKAYMHADIVMLDEAVAQIQINTSLEARQQRRETELKILMAEPCIKKIYVHTTKEDNHE